MRIDGRRVLVIGGGGAGIGRAITRAFGNAGAAVVVADLEQERAQEAAAELTAQGANAWALSVDVRVRGQVEEMIAAAMERLGGLDVLVTVVGGQVAFVPSVRLHEMADEDWDTMYEVNLRYVARAVRAALGAFIGQGTGGVIVSVGSVTGFMAAPEQGAYGVMKAGLLSLARTVAAEYSSDQIRMNVVAGGAIATAVTNSDGDTSWVSDVPMGRYGSTEDIAQAVLAARPLTVRSATAASAVPFAGAGTGAGAGGRGAGAFEAAAAELVPVAGAAVEGDAGTGAGWDVDEADAMAGRAGAGCGSAMAPPTAKSATAPARAAPPAARLRRCAHSTLPLIRATTAMNDPDRTTKPLRPELTAPRKATRSRPPQPSQADTGTDRVRPGSPTTSGDTPATRASVAPPDAVTGWGCSIHWLPSQYREVPSPVGYQPGNALISNPFAVPEPGG